MSDMLTCRECGKLTPNLPYPANDVDWCNECIQRALDAAESVPLTEERIQEIVDYATGKEKP